jgi:hypothetical protein
MKDGVTVQDWYESGLDRVEVRNRRSGTIDHFAEQTDSRSRMPLCMLTVILAVLGIGLGILEIHDRRAGKPWPKWLEIIWVILDIF